MEIKSYNQSYHDTSASKHRSESGAAAELPLAALISGKPLFQQRFWRRCGGYVRATGVVFRIAIGNCTSPACGATSC
jgi:hypothetical protein